MIIICDTFSYADYPVEVMPGEDVQMVEARIQAAGHLDMRRVMEVYCLADDLDEQLDEYRCFRYESKGKK